MVKARFECTAVQPHGREGSCFDVFMRPVTFGSRENESFFRATPYGSLHMGVVVLAAAEQFVPGAEYIVTFEKA